MKTESRTLPKNKNRLHRATASSVAGQVVMYLILLFFVIVTLFPLYAMVITSFKTTEEAANVQFTFWPQSGFHFDKYVQLVKENTIGVNIFQALGNTLYIVLPALVVNMFISALAAYGFAKFKFRGKNLMFSVLLFTMMIPDVVTMAVQYILYDTLQWTGTPLPLIIPKLFGGIGVIFYLRQFFMGIPNGLLEAAQLDGQNKFQIFVKIILPLSVPVLLAKMIFEFIAGYNDYLGPLIYLQQSQYTMQIFLTWIQQLYAAYVDWALVFAGCTFSLLPMFILYICGQRILTAGVKYSAGLKL